MWSNEAKSLSVQIALLLGQLFVLLCSIIYIYSIYKIDVQPDKIANDTFVETTCFIIDKKLSATKRDFIPKYRADFLINYTVAGVQYNRWVSGNGLDISLKHYKLHQQALLSRYNTGENYPCFYNPTNPDIAVLMLRYNWESTFPLIIPALVIIILLYYLFETLGTILDSITRKTNR